MTTVAESDDRPGASLWRARPGTGLVLGWHLVAAAMLALVPTFVVLGELAWTVDFGRAPGVFGLPLAYLLSGVIVRRSMPGPAPAAAFRAFVTLAVILSAYFLAMLLYPGIWYSRWLLLSSAALAVVFIMLPVLLPRRALAYATGVLAAGSLLLVGAGQAAAMRAAADAPLRTLTTETKLTSHGVVAAVHYDGYVTPSIYGGGLSRFEDAVVLATGDGLFFRLDWPGAADSLHVKRLPIQVPLNRQAFTTAVGEDIPPFWFRVGDALVRTQGDSVQILATHHHWFDDASCFVVRLSSITLSREAFDGGVASDQWRTLYDTRPCLRLKERGWRFAGNHIGGRLADLGDGRVIVTIGDFQFDGWSADEMLPQDRSADYGKTLVIDAAGGAEVLSLGHRNPQGLHIDSNGRILVTEHGPQGGDVLHEIVAGGNYGWPYVTYGTEYGDFVWPLQERGDGERSSFRSALFAWVPSIGVSNLIEVRRGPVEAWAGDLLISSLEARSLFRARLEGGHVVYVEPIHMGFRIRDLVELDDGRIVLWGDGGRISSLNPNAPKRGAALFAGCIGCHSIEAGGASRLGPNLHGIYGRHVAADRDFTYSRALAALSGRWTAEKLDAFLADPQAFAPGTIMTAEPMTDPDERASLIEYLKTIR